MALSSHYRKEVLPAVLQWEGGWVNHPSDPGGATNKGITQTTYDSWRASQGLKRRSVRDIADFEVEEIYATRYWAVVKGDQLPVGVGYAVFDYGVNSGPSRAAKALQSVLTVRPVDGKIGNDTLRAAREANPVATVKAVCRQRMGFLQGLKTFKVFGKGWSRRVADVEVKGVTWAARVSGRDVRTTLQIGETEARNEAVKQSQNAKVTGATGTVGSASAATIIPPEIALIVIGVVAVAAIFLFWKSRQNRARERAYAAAIVREEKK